MIGVYRRNDMKKLTVLALGLLILVPALAFSDSISLRLG